MNKVEFLDKLGSLLACLPQSQIDEACGFYGEAIADRMDDGMGEEEAIEVIGSPEAAAEAILNDLPAVPRAIAKTRRRSEARLWALVILGSPLWASLLAAFVAVALGVYACIWAIALAVWALVLSIGVSGMAAAALAVAGLNAGLAPHAIAMAGCALGLLGVAVLAGMGAWVATRQLARLSVRWARKALAPFFKRRGQGRETSEVANALGSKSKIRKACLAIAAALIAAGALLALIGFAAAGFNPSVFTAEADERTGELILGFARQI